MKFIYSGFAILSFAVSITQAFSQEKRPGYIILLQGDTIFGDIRYKDSRLTPQKIIFYHADSSGGEKELTPVNIRGFAINTVELYRSYSGTVNADPIILDKLLYNTDRHFGDLNDKKGVFFIKQLLTGKVKLYELEDFKYHYFLQYADGEIIELQNKFYMVAGTPAYKANSKIYLHQIDSLFSANNIVVQPEKLQATGFNSGELIKLIVNLNGDTNDLASKPIPKRNNHHNRFGIGGGLSFVQFGYKNFALPLPEMKGNSIAPLGYIYYDFTGVVNSNRFFARLELQGQQLHCVINEHVKQNIIVHTQDLTNLVFTPSLNYSIIQQPNFEVYAGAGAGFSMNLSNSGAPWHFGDTAYNSNGTPLFTYSYNEQHIVKKTWPDLNVHAGVIIGHKFDLDLAYDLFSSPGELNSDATSSLRLVTLKVNYVFRL